MTKSMSVSQNEVSDTFLGWGKSSPNRFPARILAAMLQEGLTAFCKALRNEDSVGLNRWFCWDVVWFVFRGGDVIGEVVKGDTGLE